MFSFSCLGGSKESKRTKHASRFQKRRNSLRGNFVTKYMTPIEDDYTMEERPLGKGSFGIVVKAYKHSNSRAFAVKFISKVGHLARIEREVKLLTDLDHANIIRLFSVYDSDTQVAFVFDLCTGGVLTELVSRNPKKYLHEDLAKILIRQLVSAVAHIHSRGICHRDIKMQNILLENMDSQHPQIKLIDFGFATRFVGVTPMKTRCGTPYSTAPEVFRESYDERCDVWSVGVVSYYLLCGHRPFTSVDLPGELKRAGRASIVTSILMGRYHFNYPAWRCVSPEGIAFIQRLLTPKYTNRWHAIDAVNCAWLSDKFVKTSQVDLGSMRNKETPLSIAVANLRAKKDTSVLGNTGMVAVAFDHSRYDAPEIRTLFQYFDEENAGFLSNKAFRKAMKSVSPDLSLEEIDSLFEAIDVDNDKQISFTEFLAATMDPRDVDTEELVKAFELLDSKGKGYLTVDDFYRVLAVNPERSTALQLSTTIKKIKEGRDTGRDSDDSSNEVSSSGIPYFDETGNNGTDRMNLLRKIAEMIDTADVNKDGVLSYSEFLLGILGLAPEAAQEVTQEEALDGSGVQRKLEKEKERLDKLLDSPPQEAPKSFFPRPFSAQHRRTVPECRTGSNNSSPRGSGLKARFSLGMSKLRSPKTVPCATPTPLESGDDEMALPITPALEQQLLEDDANLISPQSYLEIGGVSEFLSPPADDSALNETMNDEANTENQNLSNEKNSLDKEAATVPIPKSPEVKGPPAWLVPTLVHSSSMDSIPYNKSSQKSGVVRLPPIT